MPPPGSLASYYYERANGDVRPASPPRARTPEEEQPSPSPPPAGDEEPHETRADDPEDPDDSSDSDPDSDDVDSDDEEEYPIPPAYTSVYTSDSEHGRGPAMLERVLQQLHIDVLPLYIVTKTVRPPHVPMFKAKVHLRDYARHRSTYYTFASHESSAAHATYRLAVSDAARRALWALTHRQRRYLSTTCYRVIPQRPPGGEDATVRVANIGEPGEKHIDTSAHIISWLDTDLEDTTNELLEFQDRYYASQARVAELEARLAEVEPPEAEELHDDTASPGRQRKPLGQSAAGTRLTFRD